MVWYVYIMPCVVEDFLKLGFSRDPAARIHAFQPRYFEVFDLRLGWLIETESERDARSLELDLRRPLAIHRAPAPITVCLAAGVHTEWRRGARAPLWDAPYKTWLHAAIAFTRLLWT